jgi:hypothetical protein
VAKQSREITIFSIIISIIIGIGAIACRYTTILTPATQTAIMMQTETVVASILNQYVQQTIAAANTAGAFATSTTSLTSTPVPDLGATAQAIAAQTSAAQSLVAQQTEIAQTQLALQTSISANSTSSAATSVASLAQAMATHAAATAQMALTLTAQAQIRIIYIYKSDLALANTFKTFLESNGYKVDVILESNVGAPNYSQYNLIIIGPDTGNPSSWSTGPWGDPAGSEAGYIDSFGKPTLGLGTGGSLFFEARNLTITYGQSWIGSAGDTGVFVENPGHRFWTTPNSISIPADNIPKLYDNNSSFLAVHLPAPISGITPLGRETDDPVHYPIIMEGNKYLLWGFNDGPANMSSKGKKVLLNAINTLTNPIP